MATDINYSNFIFNKTPKKLHCYIKLMRLDRPIGTWLLLFPCLWSITLASGGFYSFTGNQLTLFALFALGSLLMRSAGCIINDIWDRKLDAQVERTKTRPLASGEISVKKALALLAILLIASLSILVTLNDISIIVGLAAIIPVIIYPLMKRITYIPQMFLGLTFNWGAMLGWTAVKGGFNMPCVLLYIGGIFWTLAYDTFYAHQDKEDDVMIGIKSTALLFQDKSKAFIALFYMIAMLCFISAKYSVSGSLYAIAFATIAIIHCIYLLKTWQMNDAQSSLQAFKANKLFALFIFAMMGL